MQRGEHRAHIFDMGSKILLLALLALLGVSIAFMVYGWQLGAGANISGFGWGSMAFGIIATLLVGCGLMAAVFYSSRHGYDDGSAQDRDRTHKDKTD
ncbi:MAG: hypothetical protein AB7E66_14405 [Parvibaculaceae bacterium]